MKFRSVLFSSSFFSGTLTSNLVAATALAQETGDRSTSFQAVSSSAHQDVPGGILLVVAYAIVLAVLMGYVLYLTQMQRSSASELERLEAVLNQRTAKPAADDAKKKD